jgi:hypothetical protein
MFKNPSRDHLSPGSITGVQLPAAVGDTWVPYLSVHPSGARVCGDPAEEEQVFEVEHASHPRRAVGERLGDTGPGHGGEGQL